MLESIRRTHAAAAGRIPVPTLLSAAAIGSFGWLLAHDQIHPLVVYLLQLYLSF